MIYTIAAGIIIGSQTGMMLDIFVPVLLWGAPAIIPWAIHTFTESWYFHLMPLICFPLCVSATKFE